MLLWNIINTLLALVALGFGVWGVTANVKQYRLSKRQDEDAKKQAKEDEEWAAKFGLAARSLTAIGNKVISVPQYGVAYQIVFPDAGLQHRIEAHLINQDFSNMAIQVRSLSPEQLRLADVRKNNYGCTCCCREDEAGESAGSESVEHSLAALHGSGVTCNPFFYHKSLWRNPDGKRTVRDG